METNADSQHWTRRNISWSGSYTLIWSRFGLNISDPAQWYEKHMQSLTSVAPPQTRLWLSHWRWWRAGSGDPAGTAGPSLFSFNYSLKIPLHLYIHVSLYIYLCIYFCIYQINTCYIVIICNFAAEGVKNGGKKHHLGTPASSSGTGRFQKKVLEKIDLTEINN
jgi:hypothetical protein